MKYDILEPYKEFLYDQLTANTARKYYSCMVKLLQGVEINRVEELSLEYLQKELPQRFRTKNEFSAAKPVTMQSLSRLLDERESQRLRREAEKRAKEGPKRDQDRNRQQNDNNSNFNAAGGMFNNFR